MAVLFLRALRNDHSAHLSVLHEILASPTLFSFLVVFFSIFSCVLLFVQANIHQWQLFASLLSFVLMLKHQNYMHEMPELSFHLQEAHLVICKSSKSHIMQK